MSEIAEAILRIPSKDAGHIPEGHIRCDNLLRDWIELSVCAQDIVETHAAAR